MGRTKRTGRILSFDGDRGVLLIYHVGEFKFDLFDVKVSSWPNLKPLAEVCVDVSAIDDEGNKLRIHSIY